MIDHSSSEGRVEVACGKLAAPAWVETAIKPTSTKQAKIFFILSE
jgi:hypothetical protein